MSSVFLQVGQGGNQLGQAFFNAVGMNGKDRICAFQFFDKKLHSINVDSEWKTVNELKKNPLVRDENIINGRQGRGNNWAMGYFGLKYDQEKDLLAKTLRSLRKESERCDSFSGVVLFHSLSGGTGGGFGSLLVESLREEFSLHYILSCAIVPYASGESPLQHYNNILSLAWLHRYTDGVLMLQNDAFLQTLLHQERQPTDVRCSLNDVNREMSNALAGILYPTDTLASKNGYNLGTEPWSLLQTLCPMPELKFISLTHRYNRHSSWEQNLTSLGRSFAVCGKKFKSVANILVGRGDNQADNFSKIVLKRQQQIENTLSCVSWNPTPVSCWTADRYLPGEKSCTLTVASNTGYVTHTLQTVLDKAQTMYKSNAYLHWYWKYGASKDDFENAFETLHTIINNYKEAGCVV